MKIIAERAGRPAVSLEQVVEGMRPRRLSPLGSWSLYRLRGDCPGNSAVGRFPKTSISLDPMPNNKSLDFALFLAVDLDDSGEVRRLVAAGARLGSRDANGATPLIAAACAGSENAIEALLSSGACLDDVDHGGESALIKASRHSHLSCLRLLLDAKPALDLQGFANGWTALHWAGSRGNVPAALLLIEAGCLMGYPFAKDGPLPIHGAMPLAKDPDFWPMMSAYREQLFPSRPLSRRKAISA